jgi:hypothetical protein
MLNRIEMEKRQACINDYADATNYDYADATNYDYADATNYVHTVKEHCKCCKCWQYTIQ